MLKESIFSPVPPPLIFHILLRGLKILEQFNSRKSCMEIPQRIMFDNIFSANSQSFIKARRGFVRSGGATYASLTSTDLEAQLGDVCYATA